MTTKLTKEDLLKELEAAQEALNSLISKADIYLLTMSETDYYSNIGHATLYRAMGDASALKGKIRLAHDQIY
jgi:hypothetical protein